MQPVSKVNCRPAQIVPRHDGLSSVNRAELFDGIYDDACPTAQ